MKVAIMGNGPGGSYLHALLRLRKPELEVDIFGIPQTTSCGLKPCGWGVNYAGFLHVCNVIEISPKQFILGQYDNVFINDIKLKANVAVIDKPTFIKELLGNTVSRLPPSDLAPYDRVIDATGAARAYLSSYSSRLISSTFQLKVKSGYPYPLALIDGRGGYSWFMPLDTGYGHIGALSPMGLEVAREKVKPLMEKLDCGATVCACVGEIRCHAPIRPFAEGKIWGLGESIGLVEPLTGAGIVPAMMSALLMVENWEDAKRYETKVWGKYSVLTKSAKLVGNLVEGKKPPLSSVMIAKQLSEVVGIYPSASQLMEFFALARSSIRASHSDLSY